MSGSRSTLSIGICAGIAVLVSAGSLAAVPIADLYNTGVDDNYAPLDGGEVDSHWILVSSPDMNYPGPAAYVVDSTSAPLEPGGWLPNSSESLWIGPRADGGHSFPHTDDGPGYAAENADYTYQTTFDLTGLDPSSAVIEGRWSTDDWGPMILLNGVDTGVTYPFVQGVNWREWSETFVIDDGFIAGINTLTVIVRNGYFGSGNDNPTGLRLEVCGTAEVPEPASLTLLALGGITILRRIKRR